MKFTKYAWVFGLWATATTAALAQSSVTLSGRVDLGLGRYPMDLTKGTDSQTALNESSNGRINFSGREDLGGGLTAFFMLENRFNADTGAVTGPVFFKDKAWLGLADRSLGELRMGRLHSPQYGTGTAGRYEAFGGDSYANNGSRGARSANQWDNALYYISPTWSGLNVGLAWAAGEGTTANARGGHVVYASGPFSVAYSYQNEQDTLVATPNSIETSTLAGYYDFGFARIMGTYARSTGVNAADTGKQTVFTMGVRVPAGPGEFRTSYKRVNDTARKALGDASSDQDMKRLSVGYHYPLSKRTSVNLSLVRENQFRYLANGQTKSDFTGTGYELALRHAF